VTGVQVAAVIEFVHPTPRKADERLLQLAPSIGTQLGRAFEWEALERRQEADRRRLEELLAQRTEDVNTLKRESRTADESRGAYVAYLVHEAHAAVEHLTDMLPEADRDADAHDAIERLDDTVTRLVAVADGSNRRIVGERTAIALDSLVEALVAPYADSEIPVTAGTEGLDDDFVTAVQVPLVLRVVGELVDNALRYSGTDRVEVLVRADSESMTVDVRDHGSGYTWSENGMRPAGRGGLAQSSRLASSLGGGLEVAAAPDGGTLASVRFAVRGTGPAAWVARSTRVLLVDDNDINRRLAGAMLAKIGLDADVVDGGEVALAAMRDTPYGLVFMDVQMPGIDGREATRQWRAGDGGATAADVPIVALTAHVGQAERDACADAGMSDYLSKPFGIEALSEMARTWLDGRQKAGESR
jgi:CheY-like chemotaxis protein